MQLPYKSILTAITCVFCLAGAHAQNNAPISPDAPADKPISATSAAQIRQLDEQIAPYVKKARKTLPRAHKKFTQGLKEGEAFFLTTRIYDTRGRFEQIFIRVKTWEGSQITGTIASELTTVKGFRPGQLIRIDASEVLDWLITKPDGSEEGNYVGKFLDSQH